ncbi:MAG: hypothetical protein AB8H47_20510 [Bacteroidia bacterium]
MKSLAQKFTPISMLFVAAMFMLAYTSCRPEEPEACELTCQNGGILTDCSCECPSNYYGESCQTFNSACADYTCPSGQKPNPDKDCVCE